MEGSNAAGKRICGIDYGEKRIGLAISDILHITCRPYKTLLNTESIFDEFKELVSKESIGLWVVGIPFNPQKGLTDQPQQPNSIIDEIRKFSKELSLATGLDTIEIDESFSSQRASENMIHAGVKKMKRSQKGMIDMFAAQSILKDYLDNV